MKKYKLSKEHEKAFPSITRRWSGVAMDCRAMSAEDKRLAAEAIRRMYSLANEGVPNVVFVSSPLAGAFVFGASAAVIATRNGADVKAATSAATWAATRDATSAATRDATPDLSKWYIDPGYAAFVRRVTGKSGLACAERALSCSQGGNQWAGICSFYEFFRDVAKLPIDWQKWEPYETLALHSGYRFIHKNFVVVSDRPEFIKVDDQNRPHCETGPFCRYRDGFEMYAWHGTYVPAEWILKKESLDPSIALTHENVEQRRAAAEIVGWKKVLGHLQAKVVDEDSDPEIGKLLQVDLPESPGAKFLQVRCGTGRDFVLPVPEDMKTAREANAWTYGIEPSELNLEVRT